MDIYRQYNRRLAIAVNQADGAYYRWARRSGVTDHTLSLLYALDDGLPHSQKQICQQWLIPKTTINTVVKACREAGFITLEDMPDQPRQRQVCLTEAGRAYTQQVLEKLYSAEDQALAETLERFSPDFIAATEFFTARLEAALDASPLDRSERGD